MQCNEIRNHFADYLAEDLEPSTQEEFSRHLKECPACQAELEALTDLWVKLGSVPAGEPASPDLDVRLRASAEAYEQEIREAAKGRSIWKRWPAVATIAAAIAIAILVPLKMVQRAPAVLQDVAGSRKIDFGEVVRSSDAGGGTLVLADGSRAEMRATSELLLERAEDGVRIMLRHGDIIVSAAKQHNGHLYVKTKDVTVSVVGTVFLVNAEEEGSRVGVIEGEVRVQHGGVEKKLRPGEQVLTRPAMEWQPVSEEISWSQSKEIHLTLLQQSTTATPASAPSDARDAFEVVSIRPTATPAAAGERGGGGVRRRNPRPAGEPCGSSNEPVMDPRRFDASDTTVVALMLWAHGLDCVLWRGSDLLFGAPDWTKNDGFDVQAVIPEGTPGYTRDQLVAHNAPKLQRMLQTLLIERFKLVMHRETKEMPAYVLSVAKGGPRLITSNPAKRPAPVTQSDGRVVFPAGSSEPGPNGMSVWREGNDTWGQSVGPGLISGNKKSMVWLAGTLEFITGRPVLDRTGLTGEFNYQVTFDPARPMPPGFPLDSRSVFTALQADFGLKLESSIEKFEVLVIDRIERPSEN